MFWLSRWMYSGLPGADPFAAELAVAPTVSAVEASARAARVRPIIKFPLVDRCSRCVAGFRRPRRTAEPSHTRNRNATHNRCDAGVGLVMRRRLGGRLRRPGIAARRAGR